MYFYTSRKLSSDRVVRSFRNELQKRINFAKITISNSSRIYLIRTYYYIIHDRIEDKLCEYVQTLFRRNFEHGSYIFDGEQRFVKLKLIPVP